MTQLRSPTTHRIHCSIQGDRNPLGLPRLLVRVEATYITAWCKRCRFAHEVQKEQLIAAWSGGEIVNIMCPRHDKAVIAVVAQDELKVNCPYCRVAHSLSKEEVMGAWERDCNRPSGIS